MATYNNPHWLLSHIRNSFISTDDTGMCEAVMLSEDLPSQYVQNFIMNEPTYATVNSRPPEEFICYPGLVEQEDDEDALSQSYDIQMDPDFGMHRQRSNTAQKLEKMDIDRRKASKIKIIKCDDSSTNVNIENNSNFFIKKSNYSVNSKKTVTSLLSEQLIKCPKQPQNKFIEYARFDGTAQTGIPTRTLKIFLTMLPDNLRNYPMPICVTATAKIQEFIGLICYKCSIAYPDVILQSVKNYGLYITEEDGEVDIDFPALDLREPCSKFCFTHLALVERKHSMTTSTSRYDYEKQFSLTMDSDINKVIAESKSRTEQENEYMERMKGHTTKMEAPLYQSYRLNILNKAVFRTEIQLGISGEKIEIDPVQQKNNRFWTKQKAISHQIESIAWCEILETKSSRSIFRIVYSSTFQHHYDITPQSSTITSGNIANSPIKTSASFKHYDFETDPATAQEIVNKINNILEVKSSTRREYLAMKNKRKTSQKKFQFSSSK